MAPKLKVESVLKDEIRQAKYTSFRFLALHISLVSITLLAGGLTTFVTGTSIEGFTIPSYLPPLLAALTTALGTVANQTSFRKKYSGYRLTKTEFQNLELELMKIEGDVVDDSFIDRITVIRNQKVARTTDSG